MDVIATAMVSSLGYDARTACAAARAGLTRAAELSFTVLENDKSAGLAVGHPVPLLGGGFEGDGRLVRLLEGAFRDLLGQIPMNLLSTSKLSFYLAIPASDREHQGLNLIAEDQRPDYLEQLGERTSVDELERARRILDGAMRLADFPVRNATSVHTVRVSVSGHAGVIELYERANVDLESGRIDLAIVGGVDSLVCTATLAWLQSTYRLKSAESPAGLAPGEAAALVVLANPSMSRQVEKSVHARINSATTISSPTRFLSGDLADGAGQFEVLRILTDAVGTSAGTRWLIVDQNGEVFRATDWGRTLVRYRATDPIDNAEASIWYPAVSFGDTGAASGAVATCMAVRAYERGYAPSAHAIIVTNSDGPVRGGCVVSALKD